MSPPISTRQPLDLRLTDRAYSILPSELVDHACPINALEQSRADLGMNFNGGFDDAMRQAVQRVGIDLGSHAAQIAISRPIIRAVLHAGWHFQQSMMARIHQVIPISKGRHRTIGNSVFQKSLCL